MLIRVLVGIDDGQVHGVATGDDVYPLGNERLWEAAAKPGTQVNGVP